MLELIRMTNSELHHCAIPCDEVADEEMVPYFGKQSSFFDFAKSLPLCLVNHFNHSLTDELSAITTMSTFDNGQTCSQQQE